MFVSEWNSAGKRLAKIIKLGTAVVAIGVAVGVSVAASDERLGGNDAVTERDWGPDAPKTLTNAPKPWPGPRFKPPYDQQPEAAQEDFRDANVDAARINPSAHEPCVGSLRPICGWPRLSIG